MPKNLVSRVWLALREEPPPPIAAPDAFDEAEVAAMLRELGMALIEVVQPTNLVRTRLLNIARRYTTKDVRVVALPTVLLVQVGTVGYEIDVTQRATAQLDLADRVADIARLAAAGAIAPADAVAKLAEARAMPLRFHPALVVLGYVVTTIGFGMVLNPTWASLWGHAFLGMVVGMIVVAAQRVPSLNAIVPTMAAMAVTVLATWFVADAANDGLMRVIAPSLVAILPGLSLTVGAMELAGSATIAGASRLVSGIVQLMLMVFGVALGTALAGKVAPQQPSAQMGPWAFYVAILVIGAGLYIYLSAPRGSLIWLTLAVGVALIGQKVGTALLSPAHAGALGAALVLPFALVATRLKGAPTPLVMVLAAFWALVPGAMSFESMSQAASGGHGDLPTLITAIAAVFSIALGTVISWSLISAFTTRRDS
ncbi:threonine/serine exporter family protein [Mycobacterium sp.]|uniref:threonine/serine exporter family protein n=1 Tax=Mycobacterium sp. TaxID=1785 RepID=UPI002CD970D3|nr:threonine/serine exporter family protein [Mycobacterium sp.]HTQ18352.1 threonine/serine exporter family protein [Mycobacterium sp.]